MLIRLLVCLIQCASFVLFEGRSTCLPAYPPAPLRQHVVHIKYAFIMFSPIHQSSNPGIDKELRIDKYIFVCVCVCQKEIPRKLLKIQREKKAKPEEKQSRMEQRLDALTIHLRSVSSLEIIFLHNCFSCLCFSHCFCFFFFVFSGTGIERTYWSLEKFSCYRTRIMEFGENGNGFLAELTIRIK